MPRPNSRIARRRRLMRPPRRPPARAGIEFEGRTATLESVDADAALGLDKQAGALRKDLDAAELSSALKSDIRARIEAAQKRGIDANKRLLAGRGDRCLHVVRADVGRALADERKSLVLNLDIGADSKASQKVTKAVQKLHPTWHSWGSATRRWAAGVRCYALRWYRIHWPRRRD